MMYMFTKLYTFIETNKKFIYDWIVCVYVHDLYHKRRNAVIFLKYFTVLHEINIYSTTDLGL